MDNKTSFAKLLIEAFQQLNEEEKVAKKPSISKPKKLKNRKNTNSKTKELQLNEASNNKNHYKPKRNKNRHNHSRRTDTDLESDSNDNNSDNVYKIDPVRTLQDFVIILLKFAPKQKLLISELGLKITDTFDKSIKQITGLKSREFFAQLKEKKIIKIKAEQTQNGSLSFAQLIITNPKKETKSVIKTENKPKKVIKDKPIKPVKNESKSSKKWAWTVSDTPNTKTVISQNKSDKPIKNSKKSVKTEMTHTRAMEIVKAAIMRNFLDGTRERINLSAISAYCHKYTGYKWKKIMIQTPKEFIKDMVNGQLVVLNSEYRNNSNYPFVTLVKDSESVKALSIERLTDIIGDTKVDTKAKVNGNGEIIRDLILDRLGNGKRLFVCTIAGIVLNHFEKTWKEVMGCDMNGFIEGLVGEGVVSMGGNGEERYLESVGSQKRKLETENVGVSAEPKRKKQRQSNESIVSKHLDKIELEGIKLKGDNGLQMAKKMIEKFKKLEDKHDVHFHFEFDQ